MAKVFLFCLAWLFSSLLLDFLTYGSIYSLELREGPIGSWSWAYITCTRSSPQAGPEQSQVASSFPWLHMLSPWPGWEQVTEAVFLGKDKGVGSKTSWPGKILTGHSLPCNHGNSAPLLCTSVSSYVKLNNRTCLRRHLWELEFLT